VNARDLACGACIAVLRRCGSWAACRPLPKGNYLALEAGGTSAGRREPSVGPEAVRHRDRPNIVAPDNGAQRIDGHRRQAAQGRPAGGIARSPLRFNGPNTPATPNKWETIFGLSSRQRFLQQAAFHQAGLSTRLDLGAAMRTLAKKHRVRIEEIKIAGVSDVMEAPQDAAAGDRETPVSQLPWSPLKVICRVWSTRAQGLGERQCRAYREIA